MDFKVDLTAEQLTLKHTVRDFSSSILRPAAIKLDKMKPEEVIKSNLYWDTIKQAKEMGYHTAFIPENYGGLGLSPIELQIFFEELAYGSAGFAVALGVDTFPATVASLIDSDMLNREIIEPYVNNTDGSFIGCWAITEPNHGSDWLMNLTNRPENKMSFKATTTAEFKGDHWLINGAKAAWVSNGPVATHALLFVHIIRDKKITGGGIAICPLDLQGISRGKPLDKLGQRELVQGELYFDNVELPTEFMVFEEDMFPTMGKTVLAYANAVMGAMFTGVARAAFEEALKYTGERIQGNKKLNQHQNVQSKLFNMYMEIEATRALSRNVLEYNLQTMPPITRYSIISKVFSTETAYKTAHEAITLFGGAGISKEYYIEKLFRDTRVALIEDGSNDVLGLTAINELLRENRELYMS